MTWSLRMPTLRYAQGRNLEVASKHWLASGRWLRVEANTNADMGTHNTRTPLCAYSLHGWVRGDANTNADADRDTDLSDVLPHHLVKSELLPCAGALRPLAARVYEGGSTRLLHGSALPRLLQLPLAQRSNPHKNLRQQRVQRRSMNQLQHGRTAATGWRYHSRIMLDPRQHQVQSTISL